MAQVKFVEVDLEDWFETWNADGLAEDVRRSKMEIERLKSLGTEPWTGVEKTKWIADAKKYIEKLEKEVDRLEDLLSEQTAEEEDSGSI